jgi:methionine synthase II (cobalamin-independent)
VTDVFWARGSATAIGSLPGDDPAESARMVFDLLPDLPHLVELPNRGAGADMIGRSATFMSDLPVQLEPSGWRLASHGGIDGRRARDFLARDLDAFEEVGHSWTGPLKVQVAGPITLAASIELFNGHRAVSDLGAVRDIADSLADGVAHHLADIKGRVPEASAIVLQLDEPSLPAVLAAQIPTPSGYGTLRALSAEIVEKHLSTVVSMGAAGGRVVHCCAKDAPIHLFRTAGADAVALDVDHLTSDTRALDVLGEAIDAGLRFWLGAVPTDRDPGDSAQAAGRLSILWNRLGFNPDLLADTVVVTPACGLAGATPASARATLDIVREAAERLREK